MPGIERSSLVLWLCALGIELLALVLIEARATCKHCLPSLGRTDICERLALFALVILGGGLTGLGEVLNSLAPGYKVPAQDDGSKLVPAGGWGTSSVVQAVATILTVCFAFVTYYRDAAAELRQHDSLIILGWSGLHVVYHCAIMILVVDLKKLLSF